MFTVSIDRPFKGQVGIGSSKEGLADIVLMRWMISSTVVGWNWLNSVDGLGLMAGGSVDRCDSMLASLVRKKLAKSVANSLVVDRLLSRWINVDRCQRKRGQFSTVDNRNVVNFDIQCESKKSPLVACGFLTFFDKRLRILNQFLYIYYTFLSTLDYKFLFSFSNVDEVMPY